MDALRSLRRLLDQDLEAAKEEMAKEFRDVLAGELDENSTLLLGAFKKS